ncbi:MAG: nuclear transport factor 2 family protein [Frankiaceae bacterium]
MNSEAVRARAEAVLAAWNRRDYEAVADNVSPHVVLVDHIHGRKTDGANQLVDRFKQILDAFEDMQGETVSLIVEGNQVAHETVWRGQHTAPLKLSSGETIAPTGEQVTLYLATHAEVDDDGKPTTMRTYGTPTETPAVAHATGSG